MQNYWSNSVLGKYHPRDKWVGIDFAKHYFDPIRTQLTFAHEYTHLIISRSTEFGLASSDILQLLSNFKDINDNQIDQITESLMLAQIFVQEGFASLMEVLRMTRLIGKREGIDWAKNNMPDVYFIVFLNFFFYLI